MFMSHIVCICLILLNKLSNQLTCCRLTALYIGYPFKIFSNFTYIFGMIGILYYYVTFGPKTYGDDLNLCFKNATNNKSSQPVLATAHFFRKIELQLLYAHMMSIIVFIFLVKILVRCKKDCIKDEKYLREDPFMQLLDQNKDDFLNGLEKR